MPAGSAGSPGQRLGAGPAPRPVAGEGRIQILAQGGGERALIAGGGADMVDRAVAARRLDRLEQGLRLGLERGESGAGGGGLAFGGVAGGGGLLARALGGGDRRAGSFERRFRLRRAARGRLRACGRARRRRRAR